MCESIASFGISSFMSWLQFSCSCSCSDDRFVYFLPLSLIPGYPYHGTTLSRKWQRWKGSRWRRRRFDRWWRSSISWSWLGLCNCDGVMLILSKPIGAGAPERNWADVKTVWDVHVSKDAPREGGEKSNYLRRCAPFAVPDRSPCTFIWFGKLRTKCGMTSASGILIK